MLFLKDIKTSWFLDIFVSLVPFNYSKKKKGIFKKFVSHFKRRNIFDVSFKVWPARHRNNIEKVLSRLLVKDLIKITVSDTIVFFREILILNFGKVFLWKSLLLAPVIASAKLYWIFSKFWWNELLYAFKMRSNRV